MVMPHCVSATCPQHIPIDRNIFLLDSQQIEVDGNAVEFEKMVMPHCVSAAFTLPYRNISLIQHHLICTPVQVG